MRILIAAIVILGLALGIHFMREELETRHEKMPPGSQLVVDASARVHGPHKLAQPLARGLVSSCLVEAEASARLAAFAWGRDNHFRFVARPALDEPDRRQLRGCLEDLRVPRLLVSVDTMRTKGAGGAAA